MTDWREVAVHAVQALVIVAILIGIVVMTGYLLDVNTAMTKAHQDCVENCSIENLDNDSGFCYCS